jgi:hypothetical protein
MDLTRNLSAQPVPLRSWENIVLGGIRHDGLCVTDPRGISAALKLPQATVRAAIRGLQNRGLLAVAEGAR